MTWWSDGRDWENCVPITVFPCQKQTWLIPHQHRSDLCLLIYDIYLLLGANRTVAWSLLWKKFAEKNIFSWGNHVISYFWNNSSLCQTRFTFWLLNLLNHLRYPVRWCEWTATNSIFQSRSFLLLRHFLFGNIPEIKAWMGVRWDGHIGTVPSKVNKSKAQGQRCKDWYPNVSCPFIALKFSWHRKKRHKKAVFCVTLNLDAAFFVLCKTPAANLSCDSHIPVAHHVTNCFTPQVQNLVWSANNFFLGGGIGHKHPFGKCLAELSDLRTHWFSDPFFCTLKASPQKACLIGCFWCNYAVIFSSRLLFLDKSLHVHHDWNPEHGRTEFHDFAGSRAMVSSYPLAWHKRKFL